MCLSLTHSIINFVERASELSALSTRSRDFIRTNRNLLPFLRKIDPFSFRIMSGKRTRPMIGKLTELLVPGGFLPEAGTSPRGPLDFRLQSPGGAKSGYDHFGGVGLGILAALERSEDCRRAVCWSKLNRSDAIRMSSWRISGPTTIVEETEELENFTYVTCRGPDRTSVTKVYYDGVEDGSSGSLEVIKKSPVSSVDGFAAYPTTDFLSSCNLCRKMLHGKDIYMYRGEKGFCSPECRARQIMMDERKEQCRSEAKLSSSPSTGQIFSTRIVAI